MIYVASPYTHTDPAVIEQRVAISTEVMRRLTDEGYLCYSPLVHCHPIGKLCPSRTYEFWMGHCMQVLAACETLMVVTAPGWKESKGVKDEILFAMSKGYIGVACFYSEELIKQGMLEDVSHEDFSAYVAGIIKFDKFIEGVPS